MTLCLYLSHCLHDASITFIILIHTSHQHPNSMSQNDVTSNPRYPHNISSLIHQILRIILSLTHEQSLMTTLVSQSKLIWTKVSNNETTSSKLSAFTFKQKKDPFKRSFTIPMLPSKTLSHSFDSTDLVLSAKLNTRKRHQSISSLQ